MPLSVACKEKSNAQRNNRQTKFWMEKVLEDDELPGKSRIYIGSKI
jgi:hypothetical protein